MGAIICPGEDWGNPSSGELPDAPLILGSSDWALTCPWPASIMARVPLVHVVPVLGYLLVLPPTVCPALAPLQPVRGRTRAHGSPLYSSFDVGTHE